MMNPVSSAFPHAGASTGAAGAANGGTSSTPRRGGALPPRDFKTPAWASGGAGGTAARPPDADVVLAARARLARNLQALAFPGQADDKTLRRSAQEVRRAALADTERLADLTPVAIAPLSARDRARLVDARRISPELAAAGAHRWALLDEAGALSIFINEEDHVRVQALAGGNALTPRWPTRWTRIAGCVPG
jgi:hypothetical protein